MNGNKVLVTGGFGNLGSYIVKHLINLNYEVTILTRREKHQFENLKYKVVECDITNLEELKSKLNNEFDFCVHCASFNEFFLDDYLKKALEINTLGTRNLLEVLSSQNLKNFIYFSTFHVYGTFSGLIDESAPLKPKNDYAMTHLFAEYYVRQFGDMRNLNYTILRLSNSYGVPTFKDTDKWYLVLNDLVKMAFEKKEIVLKSNGQISRDFIWMKDVASVVNSFINIDATNEIYNLASAKSTKIIDVARQVQQVYGTRYKKKINIQIDLLDKNMYEDVIIKNDKLKSVTKFNPNDRIMQEINNIFDILDKK